MLEVALTASYAVFTGDLVNSTEMSNIQVEGVFQQLDNCIRTIENDFNVDVIPVERFRGDGWQFALSSPQLALRVCLLVRSAFKQIDKGLDTRISVGVGHASIGSTLGTSDGPAFLLSGRGLDSMQKRDRFRFYQNFEDIRFLDLTQAVFVLADALSSDWTSRQAEIVSLMIGQRGITLKDAADRDGTNPQQVQKLFVRGDGPALKEAISLFENSWRL